MIPKRCKRLGEVDFLRGDEPYKGRFAPDRREILRLIAGRGATGRLGGLTRAATFQATGTSNITAPPFADRMRNSRRFVSMCSSLFPTPLFSLRAAFHVSRKKINSSKRTSTNGAS